jgi:hypothetical protein
MGVPVGGLSGLAQGGILEALKRPVISTTVETFKYGRKGSANEGKLLEHVTKVKEFSIGDGVVVLLMGMMVYVAADKGIRDAIWDAITPFGILPDLEDIGVVADVLKDAMDPFGLFDLTTEEKSTLIDVFKGALDPFNIFD